MVKSRALRLGLAGDAGDGLAPGQAVTDGGTDGAAAQGQATTDHGAGQLDRLVLLCLPFVFSFGCRFEIGPASAASAPHARARARWHAVIVAVVVSWPCRSTRW